jgi:hypothetical protein
VGRSAARSRSSRPASPLTLWTKAFWRKITVAPPRQAGGFTLPDAVTPTATLSCLSSGQSDVHALGLGVQSTKYPRNDLALGPGAYERDRHYQFARELPDTTTIVCS